MRIRSPRRVVGIVLVILVLVLSMSACEPRSESQRPDDIGMSVQMIGVSPADMSRQFDLMAKMGVKWIRSDFDWSAVEGVEGHYDWDFFDRLVGEARDRGMQIIAVLAYTPRWARPAGTTTHHPPDHFAEFASYARAAAARYGTRGVGAWEIWNEPNLGHFWEPTPDPDSYGRLFTAAARAIRKAQPDAVILTGGLTPGTDDPQEKRISQTAFVERLYANGTAQVATAIAVHPYSFPRLPNDASSGPGSFADLPSIHAIMERHGDNDKKVWVTEFGAPTGTSDVAVTEDVQATSLFDARELAGSWNWLGPIVIYELRDRGTDPSHLEQNFGVLREDLTPKKAGDALLHPVPSSASETG